MDLDEWAHQFLVRNAKVKGWTFKRDGDGYRVTSTKAQRYGVSERLDDAGAADVIITLNSRENVRWAAEHLDELPEQRILFANPETNSFWTLNVRMLKAFGEPDRFRKKPETYSSEVAFV